MALSFSGSRLRDIELKRILVIRGGALGDFILTLPALRALHEAYPAAHLEILGYKHIVALVENRGYAQAVRSIEYGPLSSFFAKNSELPSDLADYFASFDLIVSYLYDPDRIFETNLRRCGVENLILGPGKLGNLEHAAVQLGRPLEELGLQVRDFAAKVFVAPQDRQVATEFLRDCARPIVALHPGSGSEKKNWPLENWVQLGNALVEAENFVGSLLVVSGEADDVAQLEPTWKNARVTFAKNLQLPHLAALLEQAIFVGHDSGVSHLAAAAGANCILLFGPTDPEIWAPRNQNVRAIRSKTGVMEDVDLTEVERALAALLQK
jgi:heptosyltransferase-3